MHAHTVLTLTALAFAQATHVSGVAGTISHSVASPDTRINFGQLQKADINVVSSGATPIIHKMLGTEEKEEEEGVHTKYFDDKVTMPHVDDIAEGEMEPHMEPAGPVMIKGCYKIIPIYTTHYKTVPAFKTVHKQVKYMVPDFKTVKSYHTVERVVKDVIPEFKQVKYFRPDYKTITVSVPTTKTVAYKVKSFIKKTIPPHYVHEQVAPMAYVPLHKAHHIFKAHRVGSPKIALSVGSLANYNQGYTSSKK